MCSKQTGWILVLLFSFSVPMLLIASPVFAVGATATVGFGATPVIESVLRHTGTVIEVFGIGIMVGGVLIASLSFLGGWKSGTPFSTLYREYRTNLGHAIMLGLEVLIVADIVGTVAVRPTLDNLQVLGVIVLIRTFLSFALEIEINGYFPWREKELRQAEEEF